LLAATVELAADLGLGHTTVEEVARSAGLSRATVYRHFPGGRDQLIREAITWEVGQFLDRLAAATAAAPDLATRLERGLRFGHRAIEEHRALQHVLETEPGAVLPQLRDVSPLVLAVLRESFAAVLGAEELRAGVTVDEAADYLARLFMSYVITGGHWDLDDPGAVTRLVRSQFLAGILAPT
jgi:AcrR family transcriptional regulator